MYERLQGMRDCACSGPPSSRLKLRDWGLEARFKRRQCHDPATGIWKTESYVGRYQSLVPSSQSRSWSVARVRACPVCESEMLAKFASECEAPVAWSCPECGLFQLETGGRPFTAEERAAILTIAPQVGTERHAAPAWRGHAAVQAREILETFGSDVPVDVEGLAERLGYPVSWRSLPRTTRGAVAGDADHPVLILNRDYPFRADVERRWAVAEELAHAVLGHGTLVASEEPGRTPVLLEPARQVREREAKAFAAELLMPAAKVRLAFQRQHPIILRALGSEERAQAARTVIADLAREFRVSQQAMRIRLTELGLLT